MRLDCTDTKCTEIVFHVYAMSSVVKTWGIHDGVCREDASSGMIVETKENSGTCGRVIRGKEARKLELALGK